MTETNAVLRLGEGLTVGEVPMCPTCKLAIHVRPASWGMVIEGSIGTFCDGTHGHVICPCGWWTETAGRDDPSQVADAHFHEAHGGEPPHAD